MLESDTTKLVDWSHIQNARERGDAAMAGLCESGIRAVFAHGWPRTDSANWVRNSTTPHPEDIVRIRRDVLSDDDALVTLAMAARGPEMTTIEIARQDFQTARGLGINTTMHAGIRDPGPRFRAIAAMH